LWVSQHSYEAAAGWLRQNPISNLQLVRNVNLAAAATDGVIIATAPETHFTLAREAVALGLPTLCEKPVAADLAQAKILLELSQSTGCPLGINLEFLHASYLQDFAELLRNELVSSIHIDWQDPWSEERDSEIKYAEFYTDVMLDQLPHCWSVLSVIRPENAGLHIREIRETPAGVVVIGKLGAIAITCSLGRRAEQRIRRVSVNQEEWVLDFAQEPGFVTHESLMTGNTWSGDRPLGRSLRSFVEVVGNPGQQRTWPLALSNCFNTVQCSQSASVLWRELLDKRIQDLQRRSTIDPKNPEHVRLVIDRFLPEFAAKGHRFPVWTFEEQTEFVRTWLTGHP